MMLINSSFKNNKELISCHRVCNIIMIVMRSQQLLNFLRMRKCWCHYSRREDKKKLRMLCLDFLIGSVFDT